MAEPVDDARLATQLAWVEDYVIVAGPGHPPIRTPRDVQGRTLLVFEHGCPHRMRLEAWFAEHNVQVERVIEMGSYHAILGCAVAGMGVALLPKIVLDTFTERRRLSLHSMTGRYKSARTLLIARRDVPAGQGQGAGRGDYRCARAAKRNLGLTRINEREMPRHENLISVRGAVSCGFPCADPNAPLKSPRNLLFDASPPHPHALRPARHRSALADSCTARLGLCLCRTGGCLSQGQCGSCRREKLARNARIGRVRSGLAAPGHACVRGHAADHAGAATMAGTAGQGRACGAVRPDDRVAPQRLADAQRGRQADPVLWLGTARARRAEQAAGDCGR